MKEYKILFIGNSFSNNLITFLPALAEHLGVKLSIANLYYGGCTVDAHYSFINEKQNVYEITTYNHETKTMEVVTHQPFDNIINLQKWDIVTIQQNSLWSGCTKCDKYVPQWQHFDEYVEMIYNMVKAINPNVKLLWNMVWPFQNGFTGYNGGLKEFYEDSEDKMYECIADVCQNFVLKNKLISGANHLGTAIQNARARIGDFLTNDGLHVDMKGCYILALTFLKEALGLDINKVTAKEINQKYSVYNTETKETAIYDNPVSLTDEELAIYKESVNLASQNPYKVTK